MNKQAYFRGLVKVAAGMSQSQLQQWRKQYWQQQKRDQQLINGMSQIHAGDLQRHGFYKGTPVAEYVKKWTSSLEPGSYREVQAYHSADKFAPSYTDPVRRALIEYYKKVGERNRDFYLKNGFRPSAEDQQYYKNLNKDIPFPFPNHPKKKQMMEQNQHQVRNNTGRSFRNVG